MDVMQIMSNRYDTKHTIFYKIRVFSSNQTISYGTKIEVVEKTFLPVIYYIEFDISIDVLIRLKTQYT